MKKKFLSLMMAAAVVATTSVSAFAAGNDVTMPDKANVITQDNQDGSADVTITGNVVDNNGNMPTTSFKVTVPIAASFTVNKKGEVIGPDLEITNEGSQKIEVYAQSFLKSLGGDGEINLVKEEQINARSSNLTRADVALRLEGQGNNKAYLGPANGGTGVYGNALLQESASEEAEGGVKKEEGVKLLTLSAGDKNAQSGKILLRGLAGKGDVKKAISNDFKLTLRIKKVMNEEQKGENGDVR